MGGVFRYPTVLLIVVAGSGSGGCTGGCFETADPVIVEPQTECLTLHEGSVPNSKICGSPELGGQNGCSEPLTLPPSGSGAGEPVVIEPGASMFYELSSRPGVTIIKRGSDRKLYVIDAMLGTQAITITMPVRED